MAVKSPNESANTLALCIPAYNAAGFLPRLFESVAAQTAPFDEVLLWDDASTDDTAKIAESLGARVFRGARNVGCSTAKNSLLEQISAQWVHFHDADDILHPEFVSKAKARIAADDADVILFDSEQVDESSGSVMSWTAFHKTDVLQDPVRYLLRETVNNGGVYRTAAVKDAGGFDADPAVLYNEDRAFHLRLAEKGARFEYEPYVGSRFYFRSGSMSAANRVRCSLANQEITRRFADRHPGAYGRDVGVVSWKNAGILASFLEWEAADECVALAIRNTGRVPREGGFLFRALCAIDGRWAIRAREALIRRLKPQMRAGYPQAGARRRQSPLRPNA